MDKNRIKHLLVIRLSALGDVAMTVPVLRAFTSQFPHVELTVLTRPFFKPLFNGLDNVSVFEADVNKEYRGVYGLWQLYSQLARNNYDAVADLHNVLRTNILKRYFGLVKTPFYQIDKGRKEKNELTRPKNKNFKPLKTTIERYADVFRSMGFELDLSYASPRPRLPLPLTSVEDLARDASKWVGIAPFAAFEGKMYPLDMMDEVVNTLNNTNQYKILLFGGGPKETELLRTMAAKYKHVRNVAGHYSFEEELAMISNLDLMLSMDSGNAHLAAMFGIPTVTIWGVTHPYAGFYPFRQPISNALLADRDQYPLIPTSVYGNKMPRGYENAIATVNPSQIVEKIETVLAQ